MIINNSTYSMISHLVIALQCVLPELISINLPPKCTGEETDLLIAKYTFGEIVKQLHW